MLCKRNGARVTILHRTIVKTPACHSCAHAQYEIGSPEASLRWKTIWDEYVQICLNTFSCHILKIFFSQIGRGVASLYQLSPNSPARSSLRAGTSGLARNRSGSIGRQQLPNIRLPVARKSRYTTRSRLSGVFGPWFFWWAQLWNGPGQRPPPLGQCNLHLKIKKIKCRFRRYMDIFAKIRGFRY